MCAAESHLEFGKQSLFAHAQLSEGERTIQIQIILRSVIACQIKHANSNIVQRTQGFTLHEHKQARMRCLICVFTSILCIAHCSFAI